MKANGTSHAVLYNYLKANNALVTPNDSTDALVRVASFSNVAALQYAPIYSLKNIKDKLEQNIQDSTVRMERMGGIKSYDGSKVYMNIIGLKQQLNAINKELENRK